MAVSIVLLACSPKYNWREVHDKTNSFVVLLPDKPVTASRSVNLGVETVNMTMTAAEVDGVSFAVGYADLSDIKLAQGALNAMQTSLLNNIHGTIVPGKTTPANKDNASDIEATGTRPGDNGSEHLLLLGHFVAHEKRVYQVIVVGSEKNVLRDEAKTFLTSFKLN